MSRRVREGTREWVFQQQDSHIIRYDFISWKLHGMTYADAIGQNSHKPSQVLGRNGKVLWPCLKLPQEAVSSPPPVTIFWQQINVWHFKIKWPRLRTWLWTLPASTGHPGEATPQENGRSLHHRDLEELLTFPMENWALSLGKAPNSCVEEQWHPG